MASRGVDVSLHDAMRGSTNSSPNWGTSETRTTSGHLLGSGTAMARTDPAERVDGRPPTGSGAPSLVQLSEPGDEEEKAFLAALLVLSSPCGTGRGESTEVRLVTVVEVAHRLMPVHLPTQPNRGHLGSCVEVFNSYSRSPGHGEALASSTRAGRVSGSGPQHQVRSRIGSWTSRPELLERVWAWPRGVPGARVAHQTVGRCLVSTPSVEAQSALVCRGTLVSAGCLDWATAQRPQCRPGSPVPPSSGRCLPPRRGSSWPPALLPWHGGRRDSVLTPESSSCCARSGHRDRPRPSCLVSVGLRRIWQHWSRRGLPGRAATYETAVWNHSPRDRPPQEAPGARPRAVHRMRRLPARAGTTDRVRGPCPNARAGPRWSPGRELADRDASWLLPVLRLGTPVSSAAAAHAIGYAWSSISRWRTDAKESRLARRFQSPQTPPRRNPDMTEKMRGRSVPHLSSETRT